MTKNNKRSIEFYPTYTKTSLFYSTKEFANYEDLKITNNLKKKLMKLDKHNNKLINLCMTTDNYKKIKSKEKKVKKEYNNLKEQVKKELENDYEVLFIEYNINNIIGYIIKDSIDKFCGQGQLKIVKHIKTKKLYIYCNECGLFWDNPIDAINCENCLYELPYNELTNVTYKELKKIGWEKYADKMIKSMFIFRQ